MKPSPITDDELNLDNLEGLAKARALFKESARDIMKMAREFNEAVGGDNEATYNPDSENAIRAPISYLCLTFAFNLWCQTVVPTIRASQRKFQPEEPQQQNIFPLSSILGGFPVAAQPKPAKEETKEEPKGADDVDAREREDEAPQD